MCASCVDSLQYYGPDYELNVRASNMENGNSAEYLEKIKIQVIENLRKTTHAPSVQATEVPRVTLAGVDLDEEEDILEDEDQDMNADVRDNQHRADKRVEAANEFYDSDEEEADANGYGNPVPRQRNRTYSDVDMNEDVDESAIPTPEIDEAPSAVTEANALVNAEVMERKSIDIAAGAEVGPSNAPSNALSKVHSPPPAVVDHEGDVDMDAAEPASAPEPTIVPEPAVVTEAKVEVPASLPQPQPQPEADASELPTNADAAATATVAPVPAPLEPVEIKVESQAEPVSEGVPAESTTETIQQPQS